MNLPDKKLSQWPALPTQGHMLYPRELLHPTKARPKSKQPNKRYLNTYEVKGEGTLKLKVKDNIGLGEEGKLLNDENVSKQMDDLLACYLTLNADEYHDLIIKVFRQVWSDMRQGGLGNKLNMQWSYYE
ncbi:hypothetical protein JHK84_027484 [Glycine max]|nr:hypothetical protein JHK87_027143 [Glycine soja]KAG4996440.1 hypothetical protein JHK85_027879 [Glycine max]KAG5003236.1 hypothetical protein JHK86_027375 [Glycine max]KAG5151012.1 hypothetical protein JHK84_027484 [Glycine max]